MFKFINTYIKTAGDGMAAGVIPRSLHLAPVGATVECDEGGQVPRSDLRLPHSGGHLTGDVDAPESRHLVEVSEVVLVRGADGLEPGGSPGQAGLVVHDVLQGQRELRLVGAHPVAGVQVGLVTRVIDHNEDLTIFADL